MQKVVLAREFGDAPKVLVAAQPTRGLDVAATEFVHTMLEEMRCRGGAVLTFRRSRRDHQAFEPVHRALWRRGHGRVRTGSKP